MKKKWISLVIILVLLFLFYEVVVRTKSVTYIGEDPNWFIKVESTLVGLNGSYRIEVRYKGKDSIQNVNFNIHPHYEIGYPTLNEEGYFYRECTDCGFYNKDPKLLFFIVWKEENDSGEKMKFIDLLKTKTSDHTK